MSDFVPRTLTDSGHRMVRIEHLLRARGRMKAQDLMADLQCSRATLKRDISCMRKTLGAPIGADNDGYRLAGEWRGTVAVFVEQMHSEA